MSERGSRKEMKTAQEFTENHIEGLKDNMEDK